jgi:4-hydroxy-2-oxoheptanedioate aldolase
MPLQLNPTFGHELSQTQRTLYGGWVSSGSAVAAEIMAGSGLDMLLIDMEHAPNGLESVLAQLHAASGYPLSVMVRVPAGEPVIIKQVLDLGVQNIMVPMVSTAEQAEQIAAMAQYPPRGVRGVGSALARSGRWNRVPNYVNEAADHVSVFVQIETEEGLANTADIAAVEGIDGLLLGPSDLAASMGLIGQQTHPDVVSAVKTAFEQIAAAGKPAGVNAFDPAAARDYAASGARWILVGADVVLIARGSEKLAADFIHHPTTSAAELPSSN